MNYDIGKSLTKAIKYPVFAWIAKIVLGAFDLIILGIDIKFPDGVDALEYPKVAIAVGIVIFAYDFLKHKMDIKLP